MVREKQKTRCPTWAWITIIILAILVLMLFNYYMRSVPNAKYNKLDKDCADLANEYINLTYDCANISTAYISVTSEYDKLISECTNTTNGFTDVINNYLKLIDCYKRDLPTCKLTDLEHNVWTVRQYSHGNCENNWYVVVGTNSCCPEPDMSISNGFCY
ncbi:MAG: hypothetical protein ACP5N2_01710 [Candidatus Nanoarchaeia archaeon]